MYPSLQPMLAQEPGVTQQQLTTVVHHLSQVSILPSFKAFYINNCLTILPPIVVLLNTNEIANIMDYIRIALLRI